MKQKVIKIRIVGEEDSTIIEKEGVSMDAVLGAIQLLDDSSLLEVRVIDVEITPNVR